MPPTSWAASLARGLEEALENRTTAGTGPPWRWGAVEKRAAMGVGVKTASKHIPLACAAR